MAALPPGRVACDLAAGLHRASSGIVAGNVKEEGMRQVESSARSTSMATTNDGRACPAAPRVRRAAADEDRRGVPALLPGGDL